MPQPTYSDEQISDLIETTLPEGPEKKLFNLIFSKINEASSTTIVRRLILKHPENLNNDIIEPKDVSFGYVTHGGNQVIAYNVLMPEGITNNQEPYYQVYNPFNPFGDV